MNILTSETVHTYWLTITTGHLTRLPQLPSWDIPCVLSVLLCHFSLYIIGRIASSSTWSVALPGHECPLREIPLSPVFFGVPDFAFPARPRDRGVWYIELLTGLRRSQPQRAQAGVNVRHRAIVLASFKECSESL